MSRHGMAWAALATAVGLALAGCTTGPPPGEVNVPRPVNLLLPRKIRILPLSPVRELAPGSKAEGLIVRIEANDSFGDATKAFGTFRFELYAYRPVNADPKGDQLATWDLDLLDPKGNVSHWDGITRTYQFKLEWKQGVPKHPAFVLVAVFSSPFTERLIDQRSSTR